MPDFSMCENKECSLSSNCWRFNAPPDRVAQSYADFQQDDDGNCNFYLPMDKEGYTSDYDATVNPE
jgi:hypothetical protein